MTAFAEKLKAAGVDTIGAKLTAAVSDGLRKHPNNPVDAWTYAGFIFGHVFTQGLMMDMKGSANSLPVKPYQPRVISEETVNRRRKQVASIRSKYKNSGGIFWSDVGYHELHGLARDGKEAKALLDACPANIPNDGRTIGKILGAARIDKIVGDIRRCS
jgi:hypothetical protein